MYVHESLDWCFHEAFESVLCDVIKIRLKRREDWGSGNRTPKIEMEFLLRHTEHFQTLPDCIVKFCAFLQPLFFWV